MMRPTLARRALRRALRTLRQVVNAVLGGRREVLLLCDVRASPKAQTLRQRLEFFLRCADRHGAEHAVKVVERVGFLEALRAPAIAVGERSIDGAARLLATWDHSYDIDYDENAQDGWALCRMARSLDPTLGAMSTARSRTRFQAVICDLRTRGRVVTYLFGTGPSLSRAAERSFSDGNVIVCNTIVRDRELFEHLDPDIIVAGDAIYHFGFTEHARAFRRDLCARMTERDGRTVFVYPDIFEAIVRSECPEIEQWCIAIPVGEGIEVSVDLTRRFELPSVGNVLNLLLLPVGCTLSRTVGLWGFDGRAPQDVLFWANSSKHSYPEFMDGLRRAHPAFFAELVPAGKEDQYVKTVHGDALEAQLTLAESKGFRFEMLHTSWTPTLQKRCVREAT